MSILDWAVVGLYLGAMLGVAFWLGRQQGSRADYYLGGGKIPGWALASSIVATQCSTNSLLGAPAFVGFVFGGGMVWLQYELAVPLAMLVLCVCFVPLRRAGVISIYAYLESRLGLAARLLASACFLLFRGVATGVTVYGVASVIQLFTGISFAWSVFLLMGITIAYDVMGGMRAVVFSDVIQLALLLGAVAVTLAMLWEPLLGHYEALGERSATLVDDWGLTSGSNYGFWPMLIGGLFLYVAYYGCDQSQAQRLLSAADTRGTQQVLALNGLLRFPLVLAYCVLGLGLAAYAAGEGDFIASLPRTGSDLPNYNLVFPAFVQREFAPGMVGLAVVGLFAAAMSSIDSALNSLSASTLEDFYSRFHHAPEQRLYRLSRLATLGWGLFAVAFSFQVERIAPTVLEAINKIGSMANGPLLALFAIAVYCPALGQRAAIAGFAAGLASNVLLWSLLPAVSWLWWNVAGFLACWLVALPAALAQGRRIHWSPQGVPVPRRQALQLLAMTALILVCCVLLDRVG